MIQQHLCRNGVRIVHEHMPYVQSVSIGIWVRAGSANESQEEAGIAHFIEHMLFKGTKTRTARKIAEQFDQIGGDVNAFTSKEMTCFYTTVLSHHASYALTILADMFFHSVFDEREIEKEKSVILDEIASIEDSPEDDADERLWDAMFPDDPIGRPVGGREETIRSFDRTMIQQFMETHYRPDRLVISIAGNYDNRLVKLIEAHFGSFEQPSLNTPKTIPVTPAFEANRTFKSKEIEQAHLCFGYPGLPATHDRIYELSLLDSMLGGTMSSRLFQEIREEQGLAYSVYTYYSSYSTAGGFVIYCGTSPENLLVANGTIERIIEELLSDGITDQELYSAKEQMKGSFILGLETSEARMHRNGKNELVLGTHKTIEDVAGKIDAVDKRSVYRLAQTLLTSKRAVSVIAPQEAIESYKIHNS